MDYSNKTNYESRSDYNTSNLKYKSQSLCETGCSYCTGCASAKPGGAYNV